MGLPRARHTWVYEACKACFRGCLFFCEPVVNSHASVAACCRASAPKVQAHGGPHQKQGARTQDLCLVPVGHG